MSWKGKILLITFLLYIAQPQNIFPNLLPSVVLVIAKTTLLYVPVESSSKQPGPWETDPRTKTKMAVQEIRQNLFNCYMDLGLNQQKVKFFKSCISEGLIPKGLKGKFKYFVYLF